MFCSTNNDLFRSNLPLLYQHQFLFPISISSSKLKQCVIAIQNMLLQTLILPKGKPITRMNNQNWLILTHYFVTLFFSFSKMWSKTFTKKKYPKHILNTSISPLVPSCLQPFLSQSLASSGTKCFYLQSPRIWRTQMLLSEI